MHSFHVQAIVTVEISRPLQLLYERIHEWAERHITAPAVVSALVHLVGRALNENQSRNTSKWIHEETERYQQRQGEL